MDLRMIGMDPQLMSTIQEMLEVVVSSKETEKPYHAPRMAYVRDAKAMAATPADVKEYPDSFVYIIDMPGVNPGEIKVHVEEGNVLTVTAERRREKEKNGAKYVKMERRVGKFMRKFVLPDNANAGKIYAVYQDGVLIITVEKLPPRETKKPLTIDVKVA